MNYNRDGFSPKVHSYLHKKIGEKCGFYDSWPIYEFDVGGGGGGVGGGGASAPKALPMDPILS